MDRGERLVTRTLVHTKRLTAFTRRKKLDSLGLKLWSEEINLSITGIMKTVPTTAMECLLDLSSSSFGDNEESKNGSFPIARSIY